MSDDIYVTLDFRPGPTMITVVRRFVRDFYTEFLHDPDGTSRMALTTHELLENVTKYGLDGATSLAITIRPREGGRVVTIRTTNRASPENIARLRGLVDGINASEDPQAYYLALMRKSMATEESGLGIARIRIEGEMNIGLEVTDDVVTFVASTPL